MKWPFKPQPSPHSQPPQQAYLTLSLAVVVPKQLHPNMKVALVENLSLNSQDERSNSQDERSNTMSTNSISTDENQYNSAVEALRETEYPMLRGQTYLDHGGTTIYAKSLVETFAADLVANLYGNPHSANTPAKLSGDIVDATRERALRFFGADPEHFDLVFTANATAGIKLVMEAFKDLGNGDKSLDGDSGGFWYGYHIDSHTSMVGVRESTEGHSRCFRSDREVDQWLAGQSNQEKQSRLGLLAYPGQSNMTGRRLPRHWPGVLRKSSHGVHQDTYSLLDAAALAMTCPLNDIFKDPDSAPDFTVLSFYKIFGFPDMGALIIRRNSGVILQWRRYFGGGTVSLVTVRDKKPWHEFKEGLHESLEDGTLPFHSIIALKAAMDTHERLYGPDPMKTISSHTNFLGRHLYDAVASLYHPSGVPVCQIYKDAKSTYGDVTTQGATMSFNVLRADGTFLPYTSVVETLADEEKIYIRSGHLCNPGGVVNHLGLDGWQIKRLWSYGHRCGGADEKGTEVVNGKPSGVVRVSLGPMTTMSDVDKFIVFLKKQFMVSQRTRVSLGMEKRHGTVINGHHGDIVLLGSGPNAQKHTEMLKLHEKRPYFLEQVSAIST